MDMSCHACGKKFRTMNAEAKHRHNFPAMCTRNRQFERFTAQVEQDALKERVTKLEYQLSEVIGCYDEYVDMPCSSLMARLSQAIETARRVGNRS